MERIKFRCPFSRLNYPTLLENYIALTYETKQGSIETVTHISIRIQSVGSAQLFAVNFPLQKHINT